MMEKELTDDDWLIVEERLKSMPDDMSIGFLSRSLTKIELMHEVKIKSKIGISYAVMQIGFITWLLKQSKIM